MRGRPHSMLLASALANLLASGRGGGVVLTEMFTPRFTVDAPIDPRFMTSAGKHRRSGRGSPRHHGGNNAGHGTAHCGAKQCRKYAAQAVTHDINVHFDARMRWNERNAHVLARRDAEQARAVTAEGGRNAIKWGRR